MSTKPVSDGQIINTDTEQIDPVSREIIDGAVDILSNPKSFCKGQWFDGTSDKVQEWRAKNPEAHIYNPQNGGKSYDDFARMVKECGGSPGNPIGKVCGQGAIFMAAAQRGRSFEEATAAVAAVEKDSGYIPGFNDRRQATHRSVARRIAKAIGRKVR